VASYATKLIELGMENPKSGKDVGDHPPITPTNRPIVKGLSRDEYQLYEIVARQFMASISSDA
jgi:DNA topoisomerase III